MRRTREVHPWNWTGFVVLTAIVFGALFFFGFVGLTTVSGTLSCTETSDSGSFQLTCSSPEWYFVWFYLGMAVTGGIGVIITAIEITRLAKRWNNLRFYPVIWTIWSGTSLASFGAWLASEPWEKSNVSCLGQVGAGPCELVDGVQWRTIVIATLLGSAAIAIFLSSVRRLISVWHQPPQLVMR